MSIELRQAAQQALKALEAISNEMTVGERYTNAGQYLLDALGPLRAALTQQPATGEPVAWLHVCRKKPELRELSFSKAWPNLAALGYKARPLVLGDTHPAPSVPDDDLDLICNAIDKADTITMEGDYMLDSDDCIAVVRVMQVLLSVRAAMLAAKDAK